MPDNELIDAYLAQLARRLPADAVDELADGLVESYRHHLTTAPDPHTAARRALAEFGSPHQVTTAFTRLSPGRRTARMLLATGPAAGAAWATALITGHAWQWPIPTPARPAMALLLLAGVVTLATAAAGRANHARTRRTAIVGSLALITLDAAALTGLALAAPALALPMVVAACVSTARIGLTVCALPRIISG